MSMSKTTTTSRIRRRPVTFGNPALGTYEGVVYTTHENNNNNHVLTDLLLPFTSESSFGEHNNNVVAMVNVPPEQVPEGVLHFARAHRNQIEHVRILISNDSAELKHEQEGGEEEDSDDITKEHTVMNASASASAPSTPRMANHHRKHQHQHHHDNNNNNSKQKPSSPYRRSSSSCDDSVLPSPSASAVESAAAIFAADPPPDLLLSSSDMVVVENDNDDHDGAPYRQELSSIKNKKKPPPPPSSSLLTKTKTTTTTAPPDRTYLLLFVMTSSEATTAFVNDLHNTPYTSLDETQTATVQYVVGIEGHDGVSLLSPVFCSTPADFHSASTSTRNNNNNNTNTNPSTSTSNNTTNNNNNKSEDTTPEIQNCAVCLEALGDSGILTTVCNHSFHWACLWQCKDSPCPVCRYDHAGLNEALSTCHVCGMTDHIYVCLICGVISCATQSDEGGSMFGHARQHYDETLHAYALDTETQHVWDFCGQGFVHRLLQNAKDGKIVEVSHQTHDQRMPEAGRLSDAQEDEVVHRKLETFAGQYYTLLKSQLEQQRIHYEGKLEELLRSSRTVPPRKSTGESLISALKHERRQLQQRLSSLQDRHQKISEEVSFLKNLNESLETNKEQMKHSVQEAQRARAEARNTLQCTVLSPLEEKLHQLMLQLEQEEGGGGIS